VTGPQTFPRGGPYDGYPFGEQVIVLKSAPSRADTELACMIADGYGQIIGSVRTAAASGWRNVAQFLGDGTAATWEFVVLRADGAPVLYVRRPRVRGWRDRHERFELRDPWGRDTGRLLQNNSHLATFRTFTLQTGDAELGRTTFADYKPIDGHFGELAKHTVTIHDASGRPVAGITERRTTDQFLGNDFYDYMLTFQYPPYEPMGSLCLAVAISEYFYRRTGHGGTLRGIPGV
jgi:hypothetical protein